jgi:hypothetical protein
MQNIQNAMSNAEVLNMLATVMTVLLVPLSIIGAFGMTGAPYLGALALLAMAVPLIAFVGVLAAMQNIQNATENANLLASLATTMTLLLIPLTIVGAAGMAGLPYLGALALLAMAVPLVAFVGVLALMQNIQNATENANLLIALTTAMTKILVVLAVIAPLALAGVSAMSGLVALMLEVGALAIVIGAIMTELPALQSFLDTGIPVLEQLAYGIGSIVGNLIGGLMGGIANSLPEIGTKLSEFMTNVTPFIEGAKLVDQTVVNGVGALVGAILALTAADLLNGIAEFLPFSSGLADLGTQLSQFMTNALPFIATAMLITPEMLNGVKTLAETILILTAADIMQGLATFVTGGASLAGFATQLPILGEGLNKFSTSLGTFAGDQLSTVGFAANAIKTLAQAASEIPNAGGLLGGIVGDNDLGTFASQFPTLGTGLREFLNNVGTFSDDQVTTIDCAANAIKTLAQVSSEIPNTGGLLGGLVGDNDLGTFASQFPSLATAIRLFVNNIGTFSSDQVTTVECAADAIKTLAQAASEIPNAGGLLGGIVGENDLGTFAEQFPTLGTGLSGFVNNLGTFDSTAVTTVRSAVNVILALSELANADIKGATKRLSGFGEKLPTFASSIADFCTNMPSSDSLTSAVTNLNTLLAAVQSIGDANSGVLADFASNLKKVGEDAVKKFVQAFTSQSAKTDVKTAATDLAKKAVSGAESQSDEMESAGNDLGDGLVKGINAKQTAAYNAGYALGQKAVQGEKDGQESNSPSKLTILAGKWLGEGLVIGIGKMGRSVYNAGSKLGNTATDSISSTVSRIADAINTDIDTQPTIRPVLDLSDVRSGANSISGLFGSEAKVGVLANVGSISSMMNNRSQNGASVEVVSAINKLRKDLANVGNTTYSINGVTYDDGSNITDAVRTIVRAAKIERRV